MSEKESTTFVENWREFFIFLLIIAIIASVPVFLYMDEARDGKAELICMEQAKKVNEWGQFDPECNL